MTAGPYDTQYTVCIRLSLSQKLQLSDELTA